MVTTPTPPSPASPPHEPGLLPAVAILWVVAVAAGLAAIVGGQRALTTHLVDSYYYFEAARSILDHGTPTIGWEQGPENKYFPGYAAVLAVASFASGAAPEAVWGPLQLVLYLALALLAVALFRQWGCPPAMAIAASALMAGNVVLVRWCAVAMSDLLAVVCLVAQAVLLGAPRAVEGDAPRLALLPRIARGARAREAVRLAAFVALAGVGVATRIEAAFFQPALLLFDRARARRLWMRPVALALWALVGLGPIVAWAAWLRRAGAPLHYVGEGAEFLSAVGVWHALATLMSTAVRLRHWAFDGPPLATFLALRLLDALWLAILVAAPTGALGPRARRCWLLLWSYWLAHALWYYQSERYNIFVVPLVAILLVDGTRWYVGLWSRRADAPADAAPHDDDAPPSRPPRRHVPFALVLAAIVLVQTQARIAVDDHSKNINASAVPDATWKALADVAPFDRPTTLVVTNAPVAAAALLPARVVFTYDWRAWWRAWAHDLPDPLDLAVRLASLAGLAAGAARHDAPDIVVLVDALGREDARLAAAAQMLLDAAEGSPDPPPPSLRVAALDDAGRLVWLLNPPQARP